MKGEQNNSNTHRTIPSPSEPIENYYDVSNEVLGVGYFAVVYVGINKSTLGLVAVKAVDKRLVEKEEALEREVRILSSINHMYIVKMLAIFDTMSHLYIVMELMEGGELYDEILRRKSFTEGDTAYIMRQVFEALAYLHNQKIVHRDLKLENLLLVRKNALEIKIADFGLSTIYNTALFTACGTPFYVAPEIVLGDGYSFEVDLWASGILLYILLSGKLPYAADNERDLYALILSNVLIFKSPQFDTVSDTAKDLISKLIVSAPNDRLTPSQALLHPFITGEYPDLSKSLHHTYLDNIKFYSNLSKTDILKHRSNSK